MKNLEFKEDPIEKIKACLQDYSNDFMALKIILDIKGIDGVRTLIKEGYKINTVEEYLQKYRDEGRDTISVEDQDNPVFIEKASKLNKLAIRVKSLGENISELDILDIIIKVKKIIYFK